MPTKERGDEEDDGNPFKEFLKTSSPQSVRIPQTVDVRLRSILEVEEYLATTYPLTIDPYKFWYNPTYSTKFPILSALAYRFLSAPPTTAESKRMFSIATWLLHDLRRSKTPENFQMQLFLHHNMKILGF